MNFSRGWVPPDPRSGLPCPFFTLWAGQTRGRLCSASGGVILFSRAGLYPVTLAETSLAPWVTVLGPSLATAEIKTLWVYLTGAEPNLHGVVLYWSPLCLHGLGDGAETGLGTILLHELQSAKTCVQVGASYLEFLPSSAERNGHL